VKAKDSEGEGTCPLDPIRRTVAAASAVLLALTLLLAPFPTRAEPFAAYSDTADAASDVGAALDAAKSQGRRVLIAPTCGFGRQTAFKSISEEMIPDRRPLIS